jgi:heptosyltransferase-1
MQNILIVRLTALGDIIHSAVVLEFIKKELPNINIDWLVEKSFSGILENNPNIRKIYPIDLKSLKKDRSLKNIKFIYSKLKTISKNSYDLVLDMQGLIKSAIVSRIISRNIHGFSFYSGKEGISSFLYKSKTISDYSENKIWRNVKLVNDSLGLNISIFDIKNKSPHLFFQDRTFSAKDNIIFIVGSSMSQKNYPKKQFLKLANRIKKSIFVVWGNQEEKHIANYLAKNSEYISIAPKMNLDQLKYFISTASVVIGNDTGPTHLAWAMNTPAIILFGLTPVEQAFETNINIVLKSDSKINHRKIDKKDISIKDIEVSQILDKLNFFQNNIKE